MLFCHALLNILTAISAVFMAHEALRKTGVHVLGYVLQALDIAPSSPQLFYDIASNPRLGIVRVEDSHHDPKTSFNPPISTGLSIQASEEILETTLNTSTLTEQGETGTRYPELEEDVKAFPYHFLHGNTPSRDMCY